MRRSSHWPSDPAYYIEDCWIFNQCHHICQCRYSALYTWKTSTKELGWWSFEMKDWYSPFILKKVACTMLQESALPIICLGKKRPLKFKILYNYRKVASGTPVYYSILDHFVQRSQYISIKIPLHKQSETPWMCY